MSNSKQYPFRERKEYKGVNYDIRAKSASDLIDKIEKKRAEIDQDMLDGDMILEGWIEKWIRTHKHGKVGEGWEKQIESILNASIPVEIKKLPIGKIVVSHAQDILNTAAGKSQSYIHKLVVILNEMFEVAIANEMIKRNPMKLAVPPTGYENERRPITENERRNIMKLAVTHRAGMFLRIMIYCGLRPGEVAALQWRHVDFKNCVIKIEEAIKSNNKVGDPKSKKGKREVPIPCELLDELKSSKGDPFDYVCQKANGGRHTQYSIRQMWKSFMYQLNLQMGCKTTKKGGLIPPYPVSDDLVMYCLRLYAL